MVVDAHTHVWNQMKGWRFGYLPLEPLDFGKAKKGDEIIQWVPPSFTDTVSSAEIFLGYMDWIGVDKSVLLQAPCYGDQNDYVYETVQKYPDRFAGIAFVDPRKGRKAAEEIDQVIARYQFKGVKFEIPDTPFYMDDSEYDCIWETIARLNIIAVIDLGWGNGMYDYNIDRLRKVLTKHPDLKVVLCHMGVSKLWDKSQVYPFPVLQYTISLYQDFPENIWFDIAGIQFFSEWEQYPYPRGLEILKILKESVNIERILWGSDYPTVLQICTYKQCLDFLIESCYFLNRKEKQLILGENALKVYFS